MLKFLIYSFAGRDTFPCLIVLSNVSSSHCVNIANVYSNFNLYSVNTFHKMYIITFKVENQDNVSLYWKWNVTIKIYMLLLLLCCCLIDALKATESFVVESFCFSLSHIVTFASENILSLKACEKSGQNSIIILLCMYCIYCI